MVSSITFKDVEDKRAFYQRVLAPENSAKNAWLEDRNKDGSRDWQDLTVNKEKLWRVEDTNGDGIADKSQLVLEDFNDLVSDVIHDVLAYKNDVYVTVSPDLWRLKDTNSDGVFDAKESLSHGSGRAHRLRRAWALRPDIGPDGRLYWKQGDLGRQHHDARRAEAVEPATAASSCARTSTAPTRRSSPPDCAIPRSSTSTSTAT